MKEFIEYILRFGSLNQQQIQLILSKATELELREGEYFSVVRPEHAIEMYRLLPHAKLAILPGGHGDFIGEIMSPKPDSKVPELAVSMFEEFLNEPIMPKQN